MSDQFNAHDDVADEARGDWLDERELERDPPEEASPRRGWLLSSRTESYDWEERHAAMLAEELKDSGLLPSKEGPSERDPMYRCWWCSDGDGFKTKEAAQQHCDMINDGPEGTCKVLGYGWPEEIWPQE
jgi:hypothetical protein